MIGETLAHYRITSKLGEGGMGVVYRATDTKLSREVAIKVLPDAFASDANRMARFLREAQALAALNHPNIAAIYGIEDRAIIMELVEGPTLAQRIGQGALPLDEALPVAKQIAEALEAAHDKGIVHRDLKPANIKLTPEGRVKVLDFGLAKLADPTEPVEDPANAATVVHGNSPTVAGVILGTVGYMAPEQARGKRVDKRADIWAFGVVLLEMLTGKQMYGGETVYDTLAAVLAKEPDFTTLPEAMPPGIRKLLRRCLDKDPHHRLRDIGEARIAIEEALGGEQIVAGPAEGVKPRHSYPWAVALLSLALVALAVFHWQTTRPVVRPLMRFNLDMGKEALRDARNAPLISPDGTRLVYAATAPNSSVPMLATRLLGQSNPSLLPGTENASLPFFSPDGNWIGFFADRKLKKISAQGGAAVTLCESSSAPGGGSWNDDGTIIASLRPLSLVRVPEAGGAAQPLANPEDRGMRGYFWPQILPGGKTVLFTGVAGTDFEQANIEVLSLPDGAVKTLHRGGYYGRYLQSGHLAYVHKGTLFAVPFDSKRLEARGTPVPVLEDVAGDPQRGAGHFHFSQSGAFFYLAGKSSDIALPLVWLEPDGKTHPFVTPATPATTPRLSPDGKRLAFSMDGDIWVYDPGRGTTTRLTFDRQQNRHPNWTPGGEHIVYLQWGGAGAESHIHSVRSDGSGKHQKLLGMRGIFSPTLSFDGRRVVFTRAEPARAWDIWTLPLDWSAPDPPKAGKPEVFHEEPGDQSHGTLSPDGRWMAYESTEAGNPQVFVRSFPPSAAGGRWQISTTGGIHPVWGQNGRELVFLNFGDSRLMAASYTAKGDTFAVQPPRQWSPATIPRPGLRPFDLAPDGRRVVVYQPPDVTPAEEASNVRVTVLLNFFDELRRRVPPGR
ncbi:MAG: serine/threonine-protein kinase [Acidobacteria bacterium]|nr:serine/threonine-protein kinase [Acidobacteriota bacterium]